jgi:sugar O-acyltransferase (sialic acid O-acetyltransferase NeuD family)
MEEKVGIIGAGGQANEAEAYLQESGKEVLFNAIDSNFIDRTKRGNQIDVVEPDEFQRLTPVIAAIGAPLTRRQMVEKWPGERFISVVSKEAYVEGSVKIGEGSIIAPRTVITTDVDIGKHCIINIAATVSHDCCIGEFSTIGPGAHIGGRVRIGRGAFIGIGAIIKNNISVADGVVIGAGAVLVEDVTEPNSVYVGVPAKKIGTNEDWLSEV